MAMTVLFSILCGNDADASAILDHIGNGSQYIGNDGDCIADAHYDLAMALWRVDLIGSAITPEIVGHCWNTLIDVHVSFPRDVWLGTYDAATIACVAGCLRVIAGTEGYVRPSELDALLELPAG